MMKKLIIILLLLPFLAYSQITGSCDFIPTPNMLDASKYSTTLRSDFSTDDPIVFNVYYHLINPSDGINPDGITEDHILASIAQLNINFNQYNIFYKYRGYRTIDDDVLYYDTDHSQYFDLLNLETDYADSINVMIIPTYVAAGGALFQEQYVKMPAWNFANILIGNTTITHEFGHLAGLMHPFRGTSASSETIFNDVCPPILDVTYSNEYLITPGTYTSASENVTRDANSSYFNAAVTGDMVIDTPAQFYHATYNFCKNLTTGEITYISHPDIIDNSGTDEPYIDVDIQNFMAYGYMGKIHFTNGQGVRMRETILDPTNTEFTPRMTVVSALYEPYKNYLGAGDIVISIEDLGNGFLLVCRNIVNLDYFQPGFDYDFYLDANSDPFDSFTAGYDVPIFNNTYQIGTKIYQLDDSSIVFTSGVCARGQICVEEAIGSGKVLTFTNYNNPNYTEQTLDSIQASDPNLIQQLENNKYHHIEKTSIKGNKVEETIYKTDN